MQEDNKIYRRLFDSANAAILILNSKFVFIDCNEMALKILNRPKKDVLGKTPVDETISPKFQPNGRRSSEMGPEIFHSAMQGNDLQFEWIHLKKDGTELPVEVSLFGFNASNRKNFFVIWKDLTEVKQNEEKLIESEERFRTIYSKATDGVILHSPDLQAGITHSNEAAYKILGYDSEQGLIGKTVLDISPSQQPDGSQTIDIAKLQLAECLEMGQTRFEWIHLKKDGSPIWFDIVLTKISLQEEVYIHSQWRDITEKRKYQEELIKHRNHLEELVKERTIDLEKALKDLKNTQAQLIQSEKMASLGILTAGVAHEINNPLNYIMGAYVGLDNYFKQEGSSDEQQILFLLNSIKTGIDRTSNIVKGLNQFSRVNSIFDENCNIHSIIDNCLLMLNSKVVNKTVIKKKYIDETIEVKGNVGKLHQVFINILTNAIHALVDNGEIVITTNKDNKMIVIQISDNGCGIDKKHISQIMDPFFTTKAPGEGTGLGLSITYSIIKEHKGTIDFESEKNSGTKVTIKLPYKNNIHE